MNTRLSCARRSGFAILVIAFTAIWARSVAIGEPVVPSFNASNFVPAAPIDNPYSPFVPGTTFHFAGVVHDPDTGDTANEREADFVTFQTKMIDGIPARIVRSRTFDDNLLIEDTLDYYAQDKAGNVWYLGEDTKAFEYDDNDKLIGTDTGGSFHAGVNGAKPGFIMPANPTVGFSYYQEFSPNDEALDQAKIISLSASMTTPLGNFSNLLETEESTVLEPGLTEKKFYAKGMGQIQTLEDIGPSGKPLNILPLTSITTSNAVPLPPAVWAGGATLIMVILSVLAKDLALHVKTRSFAADRSG